MPISSSEIAQMNGAYAGIAMNQQAYAQQIGQGGNVYGAGYQGQGGDRAMSSVMNTGAAVGAPLAAGAMGLLGLDPMSLGLKAGMGAFGAGAGLGGAAMAAGTVALPAMAIGGAMKYAGGQMMTGAQNQMGLNNNLRSGFNFRNQQGGQGFGRSEMTSIGEAVHEMSQQFGPSGEMASFKELSGLAGKMGAMGFAQGVKDVKDFTGRFKEMVKSLKTMATDLGTTLDGAMEFAQAAKSSGVFGMKQSQQFTSAARAASVSGGLALSEVTGAASIGSQISRSIGGTGKQGAMAGIKTIGQIGTAQQMGIISEEDIYNVTGMTGAEGRQAYAASQMSKSAEFLQTGKGRRFLASIAGKNGTLDETAVGKVLTGGMSIGETMREDSRHVTGQGAPVNRANFIRNEGRLRAAALERFGGNIATMQMMEWAESKGVDFNSEQGHDRAMLFMQRQLGMGRDQADQAVKMAQEMPRIEAQQARDKQHDQYFQGITQARKGQGLQGVQQRFDQAKELINGKLQKVGQDIFNAGSESIDSFFNKLFGTYVETYSKDIDDQRAAMTRGGATGKAAASKAFGIGGPGTSKQFQAMGKGGNAFGGSGTEDLATALNRGSMKGGKEAIEGLFRPGGSTMGALKDDLEGMKYLFQGQSGAGKLLEKGIDIHGLDSPAIKAKLASVQAQELAAATGFNEKDVALGAKGGDFLRKAYARKDMGEGETRAKNIEQLVMTQGTKEQKERLASAKSPEEKAAIMANFERGQEVPGEAGLAAHMKLPEGGMAGLIARQQSGAGTEGERNAEFAGALGMGAQSNSERMLAKGLTAGVAGIAATLTGGAAAPAIFGALGGINKAAEGLIGRFTGSYEKQQQIGAYAKSESFRNLTTSLFSSDAGEQSAAKKALEKELATQTGEDTGETMVKRRMLTGSDLMDFMKENPKATEEDQKKWFEGKQKEGLYKGQSLGEVKDVLSGAGGILTERQKKDNEERLRRNQADATKNKESLSALGVMDASSGKLTTTAKADLDKSGKGGGAAAYAEMVLGRTFKTASGVDASMEDIEKERKGLEGLSVAEKRAAAGKLGGVLGGEAGYEANIQTKLDKSRKGRAADVAGALGVTLDPAELKRLGGHNDEIAKAIAEKAGVGGKEAITKELMEALNSKGTGGAAGALARITEQGDFKDAQKKKKDQADEEANPIETAIKENTKKANDFLETLVRLQKGGNEALQKLASNSDGDPEGTGKGGGAAGTKK